jgi:DNA-binding MarR family transcriptional regulator
MKNASLQMTIRIITTLQKRFRNSELQVPMLLTFLHVANSGEIGMAALEDLTGVSQAAVSRNVAKLSQGITLKEPGLGLVEAFEDPTWRRRKIVRLTPRGAALIAELAA